MAKNDITRYRTENEEAKSNGTSAVKKKEKKVKDPNKPKKLMSLKREQLKSEGPMATGMNDLAKKCGEEWASMSE